MILIWPPAPLPAAAARIAELFSGLPVGPAIETASLALIVSVPPFPGPLLLVLIELPPVTDTVPTSRVIFPAFPADAVRALLDT